MKAKKIIGYSFLLGFMFLQTSAYSGSEQEKIKAITRPCADVTLSFVQPGSISEINYREGDLVQVDDVLVRQDDSVERIRLAQLEAESKDTTSITHAEITLEQRGVDLKRLEERPAVTTPTEIEYAQLNQKIALLQLHIAQFEYEQTKRKFEEAKKQIERMILKSPIDGRIEEIFKEAGESVNAIEDVIRIVRIDPLWIDVRVPYVKVANLKLRDKVKVEFPEPNKMTVEGSVIFIAAVGDAASDTLRIRVQVPNKSNRPADENVLVTFPKAN